MQQQRLRACPPWRLLQSRMLHSRTLNAAMICIVQSTKESSRVIEVSPPDASAVCLCLTVSSEAVWCVLANGTVYARAQIRPNTCPQGRYWQQVNLEQLGLSATY